MIKKEIINLSNLKVIRFHLIALLVCWLFISCNSTENQMIHNKEITAKEILNNPEYLAISYGGYRHDTRDIQPTMDELKEDLKILSSLGIKILRTYNLQLPQAPNILKAIISKRKLYSLRIEQFLNPKLRELTSNPMGLHDMDKATDILQESILLNQ